MTGNLLAIDLGTSSVKALITSHDGAIIGRGESSYPIDIPAEGFSEQHPDKWWRSTVNAVSQAVATGGAAAGDIACIGISGQMHGTVLLDNRGHPLSQAVIWSDRRSIDQVREIASQVGSEELIRLTGSPIAAGFQAATLLWFRENRPEIWGQIKKVLLPKDYLKWRLTGEFSSEPSDASSTLLFDVHNRTWSEEVTAIAGIAIEQLPTLISSDEAAGRLKGEAAAELGLPESIPVAAGAGDVACGLLGTGVIHENTLLLTISTGG